MNHRRRFSAMNIEMNGARSASIPRNAQPRTQPQPQPQPQSRLKGRPASAQRGASILIDNSNDRARPLRDCGRSR